MQVRPWRLSQICSCSIPDCPASHAFLWGIDRLSPPQSSGMGTCDDISISLTSPIVLPVTDSIRLRSIFWCITWIVPVLIIGDLVERNQCNACLASGYAQSIWMAWLMHEVLSILIGSCAHGLRMLWYMSVIAVTEITRRCLSPCYTTVILHRDQEK